MHIGDFSDDGHIDPRRIAAALRISVEEVETAVGLAQGALQYSTSVQLDQTQHRLRELVEIINKVELRFGSNSLAYAWYRSEPLAWKDCTAMQLVQAGQAKRVTTYVDAVDAGVFT